MLGVCEMLLGAVGAKEERKKRSNIRLNKYIAH